jgi:UDP-N-acetylglucosamine:LPS N-acetylglucosamine transferase
MAEAGAGEIIQESDLTPEGLADLLREWLQSRAELLRRAAKARALSTPESLQRITDICIEQAGATA